MQKDVIYIDTEDDITAIIGKVKAAEHKIVALVPPKRIGAIQSAVNLKLVHRATELADKRLVIISNNAALMALAASAGIPVAKNLQSKPELAEIPALEIDEGDDIIDGGAIASAAATTDETPAVEESVQPSGAAATRSPASKSTAISLGAVAAAAKNKAKIPDFGKFRKKLVLIIAAAVLLIGGLIWALVFAPTAKIIVTARTSDVALNTQVKLGVDAATSLKDGTIKLEQKSSKKDVSVPFTATGEKNVGEKATGTVKFSTSSSSSATIPGGTALTVAGLTFKLDATVTVPAATLSFTCGGICPGTANGSMTAAEGGAKYNGASGSVTGVPAGVSASVVGSTAGGTDKTATVVQQSDIDAVSDQVVADTDIEAAKSALVEQLGDDYVVLEDSFKTDNDAVKPSPAVGAEASDGKGALAGSVTFSIVAVQKTELATFLSAYFDQSIDGKTDQKVYDNGIDTAVFTNVDTAGKNYSANVTTNGKIGPKIDEEALKEFAKGKRFGEIQSYTQAINGVENVEVKLAPFWVNTAPNNVKKISVEFKVND